MPMRPAPDALASSPLSPVDLLERVDLQITLAKNALELRVLRFQSAKPLDVDRLERAEMTTSVVDRLLADLVLLRDFDDRRFISLPQDRDHLFFGETDLLHGTPLSLREPFSQSSCGPKNLGMSKPR